MRTQPPSQRLDRRMSKVDVVAGDRYKRLWLLRFERDDLACSRDDVALLVTVARLLMAQPGPVCLGRRRESMIVVGGDHDKPGAREGGLGLRKAAFRPRQNDGESQSFTQLPVLNDANPQPARPVTAPWLSCVTSPMIA